jgi:hypothetical protein
MRCERCGREHAPGVCAENGAAPRLRALLAASALYLAIALISLSMKNVVFAVVSGIVGFFLLRSAPLAIGSALILSTIGVATNGAVLAAVLGYLPILFEERAAGPYFVQLALLQIVLHIGAIALLLSPSSRRLLRDARSKRTGC